VKVVLSKGDIAVATARNPDKLKFEGATEKNFLALALDVTDKNSIDQAFKKAVDQFVCSILEQ
jgi:NADP-dependent 3-hydroxy acid dehydrogenase YdfG